MPLLSFGQHKNGEGFSTSDMETPNMDSTQTSQTPMSDSPGGDSKSVMRDEFLISVSKFVKHMQRTLQQLEGEIRLNIPDIPLEGSILEISQNVDIVEQIEQASGKWQQQISTAIEQQLHKKPQAPGPLAEIDFWRERNASLSALSEQLKLPKVMKMLDVLSQRPDTSALANFKMARDELQKYYTEAKDNVKFLTTLERHFKNLTHGSGFSVVADTIPSMMNALRMVWIISRHYNKDERMVPLMERIAWELAERVTPVINIRTIFHDTPEVVKAKTMEAKHMLELWRETYFDVRAKIEASGRDARWEFDRKRLFGRTDFMSSICQDLCNVAQVLEEFYNIFGSELKAVTGDPKRIEDVLQRVDGLVLPLETIKADPFEMTSGKIWEQAMKWFNREVQAIEGEAKRFIDESFKSLRSAEGAFDMLLKFRHIRSREAINHQMMQKFNDILTQYMKEVDIIEKLFMSGLQEPPVIKNQPPIAGAIAWERSLFHRMKHTIIRFQSMEEMLTTDEGKTTSHLLMSKMNYDATDT